MAIETTPVEGKIVVLKGSSTEVYEWPREGGLITKVAGQRVYYTDREGKERFTHGVFAVCDTKAEAERFLAFTARNLERLSAFVAVCNAEVQGIWGVKSEPTATDAHATLVALYGSGTVEEPVKQAGTPAKTKTSTKPPAAASKAAKPAAKGKAPAAPSKPASEAPAANTRVRRVRAA